MPEHSKEDPKPSTTSSSKSPKTVKKKTKKVKSTKQAESESLPPADPSFANSLSTPPPKKKAGTKTSAAVVTPPTVETSRNVSRGDVEMPQQNSKDNGNNGTMTINHVTSSSRSGTIMGMSKPVMALVSLLTLGSLGAGLWGWFTIPGLYDQIEELEAQVDRLAGEIDRFEILNNQLNATVVELREINEDLEKTADDLRDSVSDLQAENDRLQKLNDNLESIVGFLNETSAEIGETLDEVTEFLAEQITASRVLVLETLENTFRQDMENWDCAYRDVFRGEAFLADENSPIGLTSLARVLDYVETRVLAEVCADRSNFEAYLEQQYRLTSITSNQLQQGVAVYLQRMFSYYFPPDTAFASTGLQPEDWAQANYDCRNVAPFEI